VATREPTPLPAAFLAALSDRDELLVSSRAGARTGTVRMGFAVAPPGVVYLLTSAFSRKALRWEQDPWVRLEVPGTELSVEAAVHRVAPDELDMVAQGAILERFGDAGAATPEALRQLLEAGTHTLLRVGGGSPPHPRGMDRLVQEGRVTEPTGDLLDLLDDLGLPEAPRGSSLPSEAQAELRGGER
jgi:hypothetical protein